MSCYQHMNGTLVLYTFSLAANCHTAVHTAGRSGVPVIVMYLGWKGGGRDPICAANYAPWAAAPPWLLSRSKTQRCKRCRRPPSSKQDECKGCHNIWRCLKSNSLGFIGPPVLMHASIHAVSNVTGNIPHACARARRPPFGLAVGRLENQTPCASQVWNKIQPC